MSNKLIVMSGRGDTVLAEWEVGDVEAEERAKTIFDSARADGWGAAASTEGGATGLEQFRPDAAETVLLRPIAGG